MDVFEQLRKKFDGADSFVSGGHSVFGGGATSHAERVANIPTWANVDEFVRQLLLKVFPKLTESAIQRRRAAAWMLIIQTYFRRGHTQSRIAVENGWSLNRVKMTIRNIKWVVEGKQANGKNRGGRRGRPKNSDTVQASNVGSTGEDHKSL